MTYLATLFGIALQGAAIAFIAWLAVVAIVLGVFWVGGRGDD